jgi:hypothetical protein
VLSSIEQRGREPTSREARHLLAALYSMATDSWLLAEHSIARCRKCGGRMPHHSDVTVRSLREALAEVKLVKSF